MCIYVCIIRTLLRTTCSVNLSSVLFVFEQIRSLRLGLTLELLHGKEDKKMVAFQVYFQFHSLFSNQYLGLTVSLKIVRLLPVWSPFFQQQQQQQMENYYYCGVIS